MRNTFSVTAIVALTIAAVLAPWMANATTVDEYEPTCAPYIVIGARGTGPDEEAARELSNVVRQAAVKLRAIINLNRGIEDIQNDSLVEFVPLDYPANGGGEFARGSNKEYRASVKAGGTEFKRIVETCSASRVIAIGYSQGAMANSAGIYSLDSTDASRIEGVITFGDPIFNNLDDATAISSFDPDRAGLMGSRSAWLSTTPAPAIADCVKLDIMCQGTKRTLVNGSITSVFDPFPVAFENGLNTPFRAHESYEDGGKPDTVRAACALAKKVAAVNADFDPTEHCPNYRSRISSLGSGSTDGLDVALLIDTTPGAWGVLSQLQSRAADVIFQASHHAPGTRYSVIGYSRGAVVDATNGFTTDPAAAVAAIEGLETQSGNYGAIYSAIRAANALDWREDARKVTLTLSASRACGYQMCSTEAGSGVASTTLQLNGDVRRAGVYTLQHQWFFESAGWSSAMDDRFTSRPGLLRPDSEWIDELQRVFGDALQAEYEKLVLGTSDTVVGQSGKFNAEDVIPFYSDSPIRRLVWSVARTGDVTPDPGGGGDGGDPTVSASSLGISAVIDDDGVETPTADSGDEPGDDGNPGEGGEAGDGGTSDVLLPDDQGPQFMTVFPTSGMYTVTLTAYLDGTVQTYDQIVRVDDMPTEAPAAPLLTSTIADDIQTLRWVEGDGERPTAYGLIAADGSVAEVFIPTYEEDDNGISMLQKQVELDEGAPFRLVAYNEIAETPAIGLVTATAATYAHVSAEAGEPTGGTINLSGALTPELEAALGQPLPGTTDLAGDYEARFTSPGGDSFDLDMTTVDASLETDSDDPTGTEWSAQLELRDTVTSSGESLSALLDDGLAEEILAGGTIDVAVDGQLMRIKVAPTAITVELDEFVIDSDSTPPTGNAASTVTIDRTQHSLTLSDATNPTQLQFLADAPDPLRDWSTSAINSIRTWVGNKEVSNTLTGARIDVADAGDGTLGSATVSFSGDVVGATPSLVRQFLHNGTISFTVDGGAPTVMTRGVTTDDAEMMYPVVDPPSLIGRSSVSFTEFGANKSWQPIVRWGSSWPWDRKVFLDGTLPEGLNWNVWSQSLSGTALEAGTYPLTLTAIGDSGQATKSYTLTVTPSTAPSEVLTADGYTWLDENGVINLDAYAYGWFRPNNPTVATTLPIVTQVPLDGFLAVSIPDALILDTTGTQLPLTGTFGIQIVRQSWGDSLWLSAYSLESTDPDAGTATDLLGTADRIVFTDDLGHQNTIKLHLGG